MSCTDPIALNLWYAVAALEDITAKPLQTTLLDKPLIIWHDKTSQAKTGERVLPVLECYGYLWTSLGTSQDDLFPIPEYAEDDRRKVHAATIGVQTSAPRAVENFLDMGHFPYVHTNILGVEPHTEVKEYTVEVSTERDEILATNCLFWQPVAAAASSAGADVNYIYRVPHPYCAVLYKSSPLNPDRLDVIAIFLQPETQERVRAHMMLCLLDDTTSDLDIRLFQQTIFGQDKPILENQFPKRLPLDPRAETPIRADKSAIAYRRWLSEKGITYGVIPSVA
ncbi:MAG: aromatic ring-hydroxylating dioxygenase subunit alpha [Aestuariivita sp.]|nr:aromatic ring-hydroxylating dioxygenase subunit alpha [Aestuariivita sp.]